MMKVEMGLLGVWESSVNNCEEVTKWWGGQSQRKGGWGGKQGQFMDSLAPSVNSEIVTG